MKRILLYTFFVYIVCMGFIFLLNEIFIEHQSAKDFEGFIVFSLMYLLVMVVGIYWPVLTIIENQLGPVMRRKYPLLTAFICNIPYFIFAIAMSGKAFQPTEAILFCAMFIVIGFSFGRFYGFYKSKKSIA